MMFMKLFMQQPMKWLMYSKNNKINLTESNNFNRFGRFINNSKKTKPNKQRNFNMIQKIHFKFHFFSISFLLAIFSISLFSCTTKTNQIFIWTNQQELVSYAELFNISQKQYKAIVVYKEKPVEALPPAKDEIPPDIVIGPWLKSSKIIKNFRPIDYLFTEQQLNPAIFYSQLLNTGNINDKQYLLPLSFNLPAIIFDKKNQQLINENYIININQIRDKAAEYNKEKKGVFSAMGFAPSWNTDFLYLVAKIKNCNFHEQNDLFSWDQTNLDNTISYLREWTTNINKSTEAEQDFSFKYLYTPEYKQVTNGKCLFAYTTSDELFSIPQEQLQQIDFRWIHENYRFPIEDEIIFLGLHKKARNSNGAEAFITWLMKENTQHQLLERTNSMKLSIATFGISGGFSSIKNVSERIFPMYYEVLLGNLPAAEYLLPPATFPPKWNSLKSKVVIPWIQQATNTQIEKNEVSIETLISDWSKQFN